jgi:hypothetical protein
MKNEKKASYCKLFNIKYCTHIMSLFESVVDVAFQNIFHLKLHYNNVFFNFLTLAHQNDKNH